MKTIAILSRKGGTGKTTLAVNLSVAAHKAGLSTLLVDIDPQASAMSWRDLREEDSPAVVSAQSARLKELLEAAETNSVDLTLIDTAAGAEVSVLNAAREADMVMIPCKTSAPDIKAISGTVDVVKLANVPAFVVFNSVPYPASLIYEAKRSIRRYDLPCAPGYIGQRAVFVHSFTDGLSVQEREPNGKASSEIQALYKHLAKEVGVENGSKE